MGEDPRNDAKVLVIGLDGVPQRLLDTLYAQGAMPYLESLQAESYRAILRSTVPPMSPTAWTSFATGTNPGQHGILHFVSLRPGQATPNGPQNGSEAQWIFPDCASLLNSERIRGATLWDLLSAADKRQVVVNVPLTYPPHAINGLMVTGMLTPPNAEVFTYPPALSETLRQDGYEVDLDVDEKDFDYDRATLTRRIREVMRKRADTCLQFMAQEPWDFMMVVFTTTDRLQHHCWQYLVPGAPAYDSPEAQALRPQMLDYFRELDQAIAALVAEAGPDATLMMLSDHGFGPIHEREVYTLSAMEALGVGGQIGRSPVMRLRRFLESTLGLTPSQMRNWAKRLLPGRLAARIDARVRDAQLSAGAQGPAYLVAMHSYIGGIYINRERYPDDPSLHAFRRELIKGMQALRDPERDVDLVEQIHVREELYHGESIAECPDVVFYLRRGYGLADGVGPRGRLVGPRRRHLSQQGVHRDDGIFLLHGPMVAAQQGERASLLDVTATILYLLDVAIPEGRDSQPILAALPALVAQRPPRYTAEDGGADWGDGEMAAPSEADQKALLSRLRGLGYIE